MKKSDEEKEKQFEFVVKMAVSIKDLMNGNPNLPEGREEEMVGHNAIAAGFQGQRQWTDFYPNGDLCCYKDGASHIEIRFLPVLYPARTLFLYKN